MDARPGSHHLATHAWLRLLAIAAPVLVLILSLAASPAATASDRACRVTNADTGKVFGALQPAIDAAKRSDRLTVRGACHGKTVIDKDIRIRGVSTADRAATLIGSVKLAQSVVSVKPGARVRVRALRIQGPSGVANADTGVSNQGRLTLIDVEVRRMRGGIHNKGVLRLRGASAVEDNFREGVLNEGTMTMGDTSRISRNCQDCGPSAAVAGLVLSNTGTLTMDGASRISHNGAWLRNDGTMTMNGTSLVSRNLSSIANTGLLTLNDAASIRSTRLPSTPCGGGSPLVGLYCPQSSGAGVSNAGSLVLNGSSTIRGNGARWGGGVYMTPSAAYRPSLTMTGASSIFGNSASEGGGGLYYSSANATLVGVSCGPQSFANVYGNTPDDCYIE